VAVTPFTSVRHDPGVASEREAGDERELELLWRAADRASTWALRGQASVQSRFGNFLLADSFLLLSWATVYSDGTRTASRTTVLAVLALTSALLAAAYAVLGSRYAKYDRLQWEVAVEAERLLPEHLTLIDRIHSLRQNAAAEGPTGERSELSPVERLVSISRLLVWAPAALCVTSLVLFVMSFLPR
jgi:hypothetical protein